MAENCHGCGHPVNEHTDCEGCTHGKPQTICWCHFTPAWAAADVKSAQDRPAAGAERPEG